VGSSGNNNGEWPSDGDLPEVPEEWGVIVIPDDLSGLDDEVRAVRAELQLTRPQTRWQRFKARPGVRRLRRLGAAGVRAPVLIISMAVLVTVASLFASAWPGPARSPATQRTANTTDDPGGALPALELLDPDGRTVALRERLPAVVLLTEGCDCDRLIADVTGAVRPDITVVTVTTTATSPGTAPPTNTTPQAQGKVVRTLQDPANSLRTHLGLGAPDGTAAALVVDRAGEIVGSVPHTTAVDTLKPELAKI
jgi:hypothetical protein